MSANDETPDAVAAAEHGDTVTKTFERGTVLFMGLELYAEKGALIPRKETEVLARKAIEVVTETAKTVNRPKVIDMCCGSGNLACAIAHHVPNADVYASDLTPECVSLAIANAVKLGVEERIQAQQGDLFAPLRNGGELFEDIEGEVDVIVCNPPYISTGKLEKEAATLLAEEPREAFDGGPYGIAIHQRVVRDALTFLKPGGVLMFEIGLGQAKQVTLLFGRAREYEEVGSLTDESGEVRVLFATRKK